ncbi:MAG: methyltransferase domain-containing protein [Bacteroidales bacterium]|nr:methyltransferase domain-containing protein [Bacteroidales bacterium]
MQFRFQHFTLSHDRSTMKIGTDAVLLATLTDTAGVRSLLDIGCGCGVVAFCLAQKMQDVGSQASVWGVDPDERSILEARENAEAFPLLPTSSFHFEQTAVQALAIQEGTPRFDLIVSNPPFYNRDLKPTREDRLKSRHRDGQLSFEALADSVMRLLEPGGRFAVILPPVESEEFREVAADRLFCLKTVSVRPTANKPVYRHVREYGLSPDKAEQKSTLTIRDDTLQYTDLYLSLMKDYLLL